MIIKHTILSLWFIAALNFHSVAQQKIDTYINTSEATKILSFLAADSLGGRASETAGIDIAAAYIAEQFRAAGLSALPHFENYYQPFEAVSSFTGQTISGKNVIAVLPGNSLPDEYIIFCAHYDHINKAYSNLRASTHINSGISKKDTIFNGANDDASGITAMLMLAKYFAALKNNERSILFIAFDGEEHGLLGSMYFNSLIDSSDRSRVKAVTNIEMIGRSEFKKYGPIITGDDYSDFYTLMKKSLIDHKDAGFKTVFLRDNFHQQRLFLRSDNYSFFLNAIPAHTVMSSTDNDAYYHTVDDEIENIDFENIVSITKAIAWGNLDFISGKATPTIANKFLKK